MVDETTPSQASSPQKPHTVKFRVTAEVARKQPDEQSTLITLRYAFANGDRVESSPLGCGDEESEWQRQLGTKPGRDDQESVELWTFTRDHELIVTDDSLHSINDQPIVCFFAGTRPAETGRVAEESDSQPRRRNYACAVHCDLSAFLANKASVVAVRDFRGRPVSPEAHETANKTTWMRSAISDTRSAPSAISHAALRKTNVIFSYVRISVTIAPDSPLLMSEEALKRHNPLSITLKRVRSLPGVRTTSSKLRKYTEPCPHELLQENCRDVYCVIRSPLASLIGVDVPCKRPINFLTRASATDARCAAADASFHHTVVYLTGHLDKSQVEAIFVNLPIEVEVHDRDLIVGVTHSETKNQVSNKLAILHESPDLALDVWEQIAAGEESYEVASKYLEKAPALVHETMVNTEQEDVHDTANMDGNMRDANDRSHHVEKKPAGDGEVPILQQTPEIFAVDELYTRALTSFWIRAGDKYPYGKAEVGVEALLDSAPLLAAAFRQKAKSNSSEIPPDTGYLDTDPLDQTEVDEGTRGENENDAEGVRLQEQQEQSERGGAESMTTSISEDSISQPRVPKHMWNSTVNATLLAPGPSVQCKVDVTARKKRVVSKEGMDHWHLDEAQRLIVQPGAYSDAGTVIAINVNLFHHLRALSEGVFCNGSFWEKTLGDQPFLIKKDDDSVADYEPLVSRLACHSAPFARAAITFPYAENAVLCSLMNAMDNINSNALGAEIVGSLKSYQLTSEQLGKAHSGTLDLISGFHIIDSDSRSIVIEGLTTSIAKLVEAIKTTTDSGTTSYELLADPSIRFTRRLYTAFNSDLKKVRLRGKLPLLVQSPEIYNRTKVSTDCFEGLDRLMNIRRCSTLRQLAMHDQSGGLPEVQMILQIESKFGEPVTQTDIDGSPTGTKKPRIGASKLKIEDKVGTSSLLEVIDGPARDTDLRKALLYDSDDSCGKDHRIDTDTTQGSARKSTSQVRKAQTDSFNPKFETALRHRQATDYIALRRQENQKAAESYKLYRQAREAERKADTVANDFIYSGQTLQYTELKKAEQRSRLKLERNVTFVRSVVEHADYLSLTVPLVDETRLNQDAAAENRARWMTHRGFVYPAPKPQSEYNAHPNKLSRARVEELAKPWVEGAMCHGDLSRVDDPSLAVDSAHKFDTVPSKSVACFGGFGREIYEREYAGCDIGNPERLPRGKSLTRKLDDTQYLRSVHLCGEGLAAEAAEARLKEDEDFRSKVVVDTLDFKIGRYCQIDCPSQTDRLRDILHNPPEALFLKSVRNARLPSGKMCRLKPAPYSIFSGEEYLPMQRFSEQLRKYSGHRVADTDWKKNIHRDTLRRASERILSRRPITALNTEEICADKRWHVDSYEDNSYCEMQRTSVGGNEPSSCEQN